MRGLFQSFASGGGLYRERAQRNEVLNRAFAAAAKTVTQSLIRTLI